MNIPSTALYWAFLFFSSVEFLRWTFLPIADPYATKSGYLMRFLEIFVRVDPGSDIFCE